MQHLIPMSALCAGQTALVEYVGGAAEQIHRLRELGLREGAEIEMVQSGSPCIIRLAEKRFCFRADDLLSVLVQAGAAV